MTRPAQTWTIDQLRAETVTPPADPVGRPSPIRIEQITSSDDRLVVDVDVHPSGRRQRWRITFDGMWSDLIVLPLDAAGLVLWANIEEWWATRMAEVAPPWRTEERLL